MKLPPDGSKDADAGSASKPSGPPAPNSLETILVVEDDDAVRTMTILDLHELGYVVLGARDVTEGLGIARQQKHIHLLLTDVVLMGSSGWNLHEMLVSSHPSLKVVYMSGYSVERVARLGVVVSKVSFLQKPFTIELLAATVRQALDAPARRAA